MYYVSPLNAFEIRSAKTHAAFASTALTAYLAMTFAADGALAADAASSGVTSGGQFQRTQRIRGLHLATIVAGLDHSPRHSVLTWINDASPLAL